jgi:hypothetical protein
MKKHFFPKCPIKITGEIERNNIKKQNLLSFLMNAGFEKKF